MPATAFAPTTPVLGLITLAANGDLAAEVFLAAAADVGVFLVPAFEADRLVFCAVLFGEVTVLGVAGFVILPPVLGVAGFEAVFGVPGRGDAMRDFTFLAGSSKSESLMCLFVAF